MGAVWTRALYLGGQTMAHPHTPRMPTSFMAMKTHNTVWAVSVFSTTRTIYGHENEEPTDTDTFGIVLGG